MNAFGYIRVSTTEQAKNGLSLEYQESQIKLYCQFREWNLLKIFTDERSGRDSNRPAFREMQARMLVGEAKVVVFLRFNRVFRNFTAANQLWNEFHHQAEDHLAYRVSSGLDLKLISSLALSRQV